MYEHPHDSRLLIKLFTDSKHSPRPRRGDDARHIEELGNLGDGLSLTQRLILSENFSWPLEIYGDMPGVVSGIGIIKAPDDFWIEVEYTTGSKKRMFLDSGFLTTDYLRRPAIRSAPTRYKGLSLGDRVDIALEFLHSMQVLWDIGYRYCDYKEQNFSFTLTGRPRVFIIDAESISPPGESEIRSPGWEPAHGLGFSMESDRSLACLLVWRIIGGEPGIAPPRVDGEGLLRNLDPDTIRLLEEGYLQGEQRTIDLLKERLARFRSDDGVRANFRWAVDRQLATLVLRYAPSSPTREEARILEDARAQRELEVELLSLDPRTRHFRKSRMVPLPGFVFDIPDSVSVGSVSQDEENIRQLALDGEFEEIALAFRSGQSTAHIGAVVSRSIQSALAQIGPPPLRLTTTYRNELQLQWSWPGTDLVTGARVRLYAPDGTLAQEGYCDRATRNPSVTVRDQAGVPQGSRFVVSYAMHFEDGVKVICPLGSEVSVGAHSGAADTRTVRVLSPPLLRDPGNVIDAGMENAVTRPVVGLGHETKVDVQASRRPRPVDAVVPVPGLDTTTGRAPDSPPRPRGPFGRVVHALGGLLGVRPRRR